MVQQSKWECMEIYFQFLPCKKQYPSYSGTWNQPVEGTALFLIEGLPRKSIFSGYLQAWDQALDAELCQQCQQLFPVQLLIGLIGTMAYKVYQ